MTHADRIIAARSSLVAALAHLELVTELAAAELPPAPAGDQSDDLDAWEAWDDAEIDARHRHGVPAAEQAKQAAEDALLRATRAAMLEIARNAADVDGVALAFAGALGEPRSTGGTGINFKARRRCLELSHDLNVRTLDASTLSGCE